MARWLDAVWEQSDLDMVPRADRRFGPYRQYEPDLVTSRPLSMSPEANRNATVAERAVRELATGPGAQALEGALSPSSTGLPARPRRTPPS